MAATEWQPRRAASASGSRAGRPVAAAPGQEASTVVTSKFKLKLQATGTGVGMAPRESGCTQWQATVTAASVALPASSGTGSLS